MLQSNSASAYGLKASTVLEKMDSKQTNAYVTGIIEGLAYARYIKEGKRIDGGMKCINDWFYNGKTIKQVMRAFSKFKKHAASSVVAAMVAQKCGE